jgi:hypothetical protein
LDELSRVPKDIHPLLVLDKDEILKVIRGEGIEKNLDKESIEALAQAY